MDLKFIFQVNKQILESQDFDMRIEHNSRNEFYRMPFGAVTTDEEVRIRIGLLGGGIPEFVRLIFSGRDKEIKTQDMSYICEIGEFCMYETIIPKQKCGNVWYYFEVKTSSGHLYYGNNRNGLGGVGEIYQDRPDSSFQITVYSPDYKTPKWWKNSVCYQIFCDRFYNGNEDSSFLGKRQDIIKRKWNEVPFYSHEQFGGEYLANDFFGGNLKGIGKKLGYLKELGIDAVYLNPIFKAYSNHKYDTGDYMQIDEMFGTSEDFSKLCSDAGKLGIRFVLDGVFNHTGSDSKYFNKNGNYDSIGAYQSQMSEYYDWYNFTEWKDKYESWWGMLTLPQVDEHSESYQDYILKNDDSVVKHWLKMGASGWRLDVVDELPDFFVKILRREVKKQNPDAVIIGEVWEDASNKISYGEEREYFLGEELDSVMNYPLRDALVMAVLGKISAEELDARLMSIKENYPKPAFYSLLNMLSSHDMERILTVMSGAPDRHSVDKKWQAEYKIHDMEIAIKKTKQIVMLQMLLPGVPCIYYGDEAGLSGYGDPFCRNTYPWGEENQDMLAFYKNAIAIRKGSEAYVGGEFETVYKFDKCYAFIRYTKDDKRIVVANFNDNSKCVRIDLARYGINHLISEIYSDEEYYSDNGIYYIEIPENGVKVFKSQK